MARVSREIATFAHPPASRHEATAHQQARKHPATNRSAIDALELSANKIIGIDGGIRMSIVAAAASVAAEKRAAG